MERYQYRVAWRDTTRPEDEYHGRWNDDRAIVQAWADEMNAKHPTYQHWVQAQRVAESEASRVRA